MYSSISTDISDDASGLGQLTPEQKERLTDILDQYLSRLENGLPPHPERLLDENPDLAGSLRAYLDSLEALHGAAAGFGNPSGESTRESDDGDTQEHRLGDFLLQREVGRGGMGVVYEARQISLGRQVALKVLPFAAVLDAKQIARFKNEAQAAAQLHHPNIVPVFAIGAERGVHYYAMQLINGQSLDHVTAELRVEAGLPPGAGTATSRDDGDVTATDSCPSTHQSAVTKALRHASNDFRAVARLGVQAAEALHAAHEYGVVHRDIKPSNLLLDETGKLWVTDFGLARCQSDMALTRTGDVVGTMRYMSPEQAGGDSALVDQRTDVYSLGVTLYELLTLHAAFPGEHGPTLLREIEQREPRRPRQLNPKIPVDLETVILKAVAKSRDERYATAREFAEDLGRYLKGKPTIARPPSAANRVAKWVRHHNRLVAAAAAVCLMATVGLAASTLLIAREKARTEENFQKADAYFRKAREVLDNSGIRLNEKLAGIPGAENVRQELLQDTLNYYHDFAEQAGDDPALSADLALTFSKMGTITEQIGSEEEALAAHRRARDLFEQLSSDEPDVAAHRHYLAMCDNDIGQLLSQAGQTDEAVASLGKAIGMHEQLVREFPNNRQYRRDEAKAHHNLGLLQSQIGQRDKAKGSFQTALRLQRQLADEQPGDVESLRYLAATYNNLSVLHIESVPEQAVRCGEEALDKAVECYDKALAIQQRLVEEHPEVREYQRDLALTYNNLGSLQRRRQRLSKAAHCFGQAISLQRQLVDATPDRKDYRSDLAVSCNNLGLVQRGLGLPADAERSFAESLGLQELLVRQHPRNVEFLSILGGIYNNLGMVREGMRREVDAADAYAFAVKYQRVAHTAAPKIDRFRIYLSKHYYNYGRVLRQLHRPDEAVQVALARKALWPGDAKKLFTVAEEIALACGVPGQGNSSPHENDVVWQRHANQCLAVLEEAVDAGLPLLDAIADNDAFASVRDHPDFFAMVNDQN